MAVADENGESSDVSREFVLKLMKEKDSIEDEIRKMQDLLKSEKNVGLFESLVDAEGYPRSDIDICSVRTARSKIICLQNDYKQIMSQIERSLHLLHSKQKTVEDVGVGLDVERSSNRTAEEDLQRPFARIEIVTGGSPAKDAGMQVEDLILEFGSVNCKNFTGLQNIADVVQHSLSKPISITVLRDGTVVHLGLVQRHWSGKGLIGCKIVPVNQ